MPEKCMGCLYGERKTKESDFIPETRQKKPSRHSGIIAKIKILRKEDSIWISIIALM